MTRALSVQVDGISMHNYYFLPLLLTHRHLLASSPLHVCLFSRFSPSAFEGAHTLPSIAVDRTPQQSYQPANSSQYVPPMSGFQGTALHQRVIVDVQISSALVC